MNRRPVAIIVALLAAALVVSFAGFLLLYLAVGREPAVPSRAALSLEIGGDIAELPASDVVAYLSDARAPTVRGFIDNLRKAKSDNRVRAVLLKPTTFSSPYWGKIQEIRDALVDFKESGKPLYAYLEYGGDREYFLASAADKVFMMPATTLDLTGVATYQVFLRGTFDKIGVTPDIHHVGDFKTASNQYTEKGYTPSHRAMDEWLNRELYEQIVSAIAHGRKKSDAEVRALIEEGPFLAEHARRAGLVDELLYEDQVAEKLKDESGGLSTLDADDYGRVSVGSSGFDRGPRIAVIYAVGAIVGGRSGYDPLNGATVGSETLNEAIRAARRDSSVRAIVLRVDSPGGSATASDAVWRELMLARDDKPLDRLDVGSGGVGRLLHRDAGARDCRAAVHVNRIDRHLWRQVHHRRCLREARRQHRVDEHRQARRDELAGPAVQRGRAEEGQRAAGVLLRPSSSEKSRPRGERRPNRSTRSPKAASGPAGRRRRTAWSTRSADWRPRSTSPRRRRASMPTTASNWSSIRRRRPSTSS